MGSRRISLLALVAALVAAVGIGSAEAGRGKHRGTTRVCTTKQVGKQQKRTCKRVAIFQGHNADRKTLRTEPLDKPSGVISISAPNFNQTLDVNIYRADGSFDDAALAQLDEIFRCKRTNEVRAVDPRLYEMLSRFHDHFDGKQIELVSGFRFPERDSSRHHHASAMDFRISGVSINTLYAYAESLDAGGMGVGLYPTSGFIHFDYRAPGEPSYRWTDLSGPSGGGGAGPKAKPAKAGATAKSTR